MRAFMVMIVAAALTGAMEASAAQAQDLSRTTQQLHMQGDAPAGCVANAARASNQRNASYQAAPGLSALQRHVREDAAQDDDGIDPVHMSQQADDPSRF